MEDFSLQERRISKMNNCFTLHEQFATDYLLELKWQNCFFGKKKKKSMWYLFIHREKIKL